MKKKRKKGNKNDLLRKLEKEKIELGEMWYDYLTSISYEEYIS